MNLSLDDLPGSLREIAELIGLPATLRLVEHYGGVIALYIPREIEPDHHLARALGVTAARKLASHYGTDSLRNIPRCVRGLRRLRDTEIRACRAAGESPPALALKFGLTERQIWTILAEGREGADGKQAALF